MMVQKDKICICKLILFIRYIYELVVGNARDDMGTHLLTLPQAGREKTWPGSVNRPRTQNVNLHGWTPIHCCFPACLCKWMLIEFYYSQRDILNAFASK